MLATFVIGLREGLEAALIVGIIAAFLKRNGKSLAPMWLGIGLALTLSVLVGVILKVVESSLPQAAQEGMETVIGLIAVVFVTGMVLWMSTNARGLKGELEAAAGEALAGGTARALAVMAFLAVLKEGFETAVFLLATFQAAGSVASAATGAVLGVAVSIALGIGLYRGGVKINLGKFFKVTGVFLVFVAAGLVVTALRTAHEAGWLNVGQQATVDLGWLAPSGSIRGALITGVLGIPPQPRLIEVLGWFAYVIPVLTYLYLPATLRPAPRLARRLRLGGAAACALAALLLLIFVQTPKLSVPSQAPLDPKGGVSLSGRSLHTPNGTVKLSEAGSDERNGVTVDHLHASIPASAQRFPATLTASALAELNGGRMPFGIDATKNPGPYQAQWSSGGAIDAYTARGKLVDARAQQNRVVTLTGGGLTTPRTVSVADGSPLPGGSTVRNETWSVKASYTTKITSQLRGLTSRTENARFWRFVVPVLLVCLAALLLLSALRQRRQDPARRDGDVHQSTSTGSTAASQTRTAENAHH